MTGSTCTLFAVFGIGQVDPKKGFTVLELGQFGSKEGQNLGRFLVNRWSKSNQDRLVLKKAQSRDRFSTWTKQGLTSVSYRAGKIGEKFFKHQSGKKIFIASRAKLELQVNFGDFSRAKFFIFLLIFPLTMFPFINFYIYFINLADY